jgi:hypothetical protein
MWSLGLRCNDYGIKKSEICATHGTYGELRYVQAIFVGKPQKKNSLRRPVAETTF